MDRDNMNKDFNFMEKHKTKFHKLSILKPLWRRQNFGSKGGTFSKNVLIKF